MANKNKPAEVIRYAVRIKTPVTVRGGWQVWEVLSNDTWGKCISTFRTRREAARWQAQLNDALTVQALIEEQIFSS